MSKRTGARARRGHGEGSVYQRHDGRWVGVIDCGWQGGRRVRKHIYGRTQADIVNRMADGRKAAKDGMLILDERQTVETFLHRWLEDCARRSVRPTTFRRYRDLVRSHIAPDLGKVPLARLNGQMIQRWLNDKLGGAALSRPRSGRPAPGGLAPRTVRHMHAVLRVALRQAVAWHLVPMNAALAVRPPSVPHFEVNPFTVDEARTFLDAVDGHRLEALFTVALACGLRQGEALGLRWQDVDVDGGTLRVSQQLQRIDGKLTLGEPKSKRSRRTIALPDIVRRALRAHRTRQLEERLLAGSAWRDTGFVFTTGIGTPLDPRNAQTAFKAVLRQAGLRPQRFHDLRHAAATLLLAQGVLPRTVMEILGHSQISVTMDTYSHIFPELKQDAADRMNAALSPTTGAKAVDNKP